MIFNADNQKTSIILADDHPLMRQALRMWIEKQHDLEVVAETSDGMETVEVTAKLKPNVVVMDICMPKLNGLEATKRITTSCPETEVLVVTFYTDNEHILGIMQAGASGYLAKDASGDQIIHAIRTVADGEKFFPNATSPNVDEDTIHINELLPINKKYRLTIRELEILRLIAKGMSNKDIASELHLSLPWVKANLTNVFLKLGVRSRTEVISISLQTGILTLNDLSQGKR